MAHFTAENAAIYAKRGNIALAAIRERKKIESASPEEKQRISELHKDLRLARVRKQQEMLDDLMDAELKSPDFDAAKIDRMASAAVRLNELERQYSNRSLPPTLKAGTPPRTPRARTEPEPSPE